MYEPKSKVVMKLS